jgi:RimJ/RimL family protein N-acetyltransferase
MNDLTLESKRLTLRPFRESDILKVHELLLRPESTEFNPTTYSDNEEETKKLVTSWQKESELESSERNLLF